MTGRASASIVAGMAALTVLSLGWVLLHGWRLLHTGGGASPFVEAFAVFVMMLAMTMMSDVLLGGYT